MIELYIDYKIQDESSQLANIDLIYKSKGENEKALKYLNEALTILDDHNLAYGRGNIINTIKEIENQQSADLSDNP